MSVNYEFIHQQVQFPTVTLPSPDLDKTGPCWRLYSTPHSVRNLPSPHASSPERQAFRQLTTNDISWFTPSFFAVVAQCRRHLSGSLSPSSPEGHALTLSSASFLSWLAFLAVIDACHSLSFDVSVFMHPFPTSSRLIFLFYDKNCVVEPTTMISSPLRGER